MALTKAQIDAQEPDYDAVKRIAATYFAIHIGDFMAMSPDEHVRIAESAGVDESRMPGFYKALMTMAHMPKDCPKVN